MIGTLVAATPAHAAAMAAIHAAAFPPSARWGADAMALQLALFGGFGFIDPAGGIVLARVVADEAEILTLAVIPSARRTGRGRGLLAAAEHHAVGLGAASIFLEVAAENEAARGLYAARGYRPVGRRLGYYGEGADALLMRRNLTRAAAADG